VEMPRAASNIPVLLPASHAITAGPWCCISSSSRSASTTLPT
jgi:hypothetical protein